MTTLPPGPLLTCAESHYIVHYEAPFVMHIDQPSPQLKALMANHNALSTAFITAWNSFRQSLTAIVNAPLAARLPIWALDGLRIFSRY
jgi:hypothetical protein